MSWQVVKLDDIFEIARGGSPRPIEAFLTEEENGVNWIMIGDTKDGGKYIENTAKKIKPEGVRNSRFVREGDFLLTNSMSFGRPYILKTSGCIHDGWLVLSPKNENVYRDYFYYYLGSDEIKAKLSLKAAGAVVKNLNKDIVKQLQIPLPPLPQQKKIAAILDAADKNRQLTKALIAKYDELTQSLFLDMFGDPVKNEKGWEKTKLEKIGKWQTGGTPSRSKQDYFNGSIPWLSSGELNQMFTVDSKEQITELAIKESNTKIIEVGSLLLGMYDTAALKSTINLVPLTCNQAIAYSRLNEEIANTIYVYHIIQIGKDEFKKLQRGVRQKNLNLSIVKSIEILLPPLTLQNQFAARVKAIETQKAQAQVSLDKAEELFNSLLQRAFKGELV